MKNFCEFAEWSYKSHEHDCSSMKRERSATWFRDDTVDAWRHIRMYQLIDPLLAVFPESAWITVGDGRHGSDAHYIASKGGHALATNISDELLKESHEAGYIGDFSRQNAEDLTMPDQAFDFAFCKESYHHFPRPMIALYEMLRVTREGVVLIEPNDRYCGGGGWGDFYNGIVNALIKCFFRVTVNKHNYESVGNYVYSISEREIEKAALGINLPVIAFKGVNDYYQEGVEFEVASPDSKVFKKVRRIISFYDLLSKLRIVKYRYLCAMMFKNPLSDDLRRRLVAGGYRIVDLPKNPFLNPVTPEQAPEINQKV